MKHILLIDPLEKLNVKKDSSLLLALVMQQEGLEVELLFEENFYIENKKWPKWKTYKFEGAFDFQTFVVTKFELKTQKESTVDTNCTIHMRLDPPFDGRYLRYLWMLKYLEDKGVKVLNSPQGVLQYNEKILAYTRELSHESFVGGDVNSLIQFLKQLKSLGHESYVIKPLDLYQGFGVEKLDLKKIEDKNFTSFIKEKIKSMGGALVAQPFIAQVAQGEVRALYYKSKELGSIIKVPPKGHFLANIAQGASFSAIALTQKMARECQIICQQLEKLGVDWVAFDILGEKISEVNITCPGLLVEVCKAHQKNFALEILKF